MQELVELSEGWLDIASRASGPFNSDESNLQDEIRKELLFCIKCRAYFAIVICPTKQFRPKILEITGELRTDYSFFVIYVTRDRPIQKYLEKICMNLGEK